MTSLPRGYKAVFLGLGCHVGSAMSIPGEDAAGVVQGVRAAAGSEPGEKSPRCGKKMVVIGGGNVAFDVARSAKRLGSDVTILYRRTRAEMPANAEEIEEAECENIPIEYLVAPKEVVVAGGKAVRPEMYPHGAGGAGRLGAPAAHGSAGFGIRGGLRHDRPGHRPAGQPERPGENGGITTTKWGTIEVNDVTYETLAAGGFAAGDVHTGPWIAIGAVAGGKEAAESIDRCPPGAGPGGRPGPEYRRCQGHAKLGGHPPG